MSFCTPCDQATNKNLSSWFNRSLRPVYADLLNDAYGLLFEWQKKKCELTCELAYWVVGREFGEEHPQKPIEGGSGCSVTCELQLTQYMCDVVSCQFGYPVTPESLDDDDYTSGYGNGVHICNVQLLLCAIEEATQAVQDACALIEVDIAYEKGQRGNLDVLRERKGITDDDLGIIYADREDAMILVSPEGELSTKYKEDARLRKNLWIGAAVLGGVILLGGGGIFYLKRGER